MLENKKRELLYNLKKRESYRIQYIYLTSSFYQLGLLFAGDRNLTWTSLRRKWRLFVYVSGKHQADLNQARIQRLKWY